MRDKHLGEYEEPPWDCDVAAWAKARVAHVTAERDQYFRHYVVLSEKVQLLRRALAALDIGNE